MRSGGFPYAFTLTTMFAASMLVSCAARPARLSPENVSPSVLLPAAQGGIIDGRGRFREIFKDALRAQRAKDAAQEPWDDSATLWKLPGEFPSTGKPTPSGPSGGSFRVVIVPGLLAECVAHKSMAFGDARARLEEIGYKTDYIQTRGRKGSDVNADLIRDAVMGMPAGERLIFVTHSKGTVDTLEAIVKYPAIAERTAAVISFSGAVNGSPLADAFPGVSLKTYPQVAASIVSCGRRRRSR